MIIVPAINSSGPTGRRGIEENYHGAYEFAAEIPCADAAVELSRRLACDSARRIADSAGLRAGRASTGPRAGHRTESYPADSEAGGSVTVIFQDDSKHPAKIIGRDAKTDLALLKIDTDQPLPFVTWGDSDAAKVGDWILAIGNPFGLGGTVTTGIISARGRDIHSGPFDDFLQLDAAINRGNSGGPTFTQDGQVIGINTAIYSPNGGRAGIGFAIPSNLAKSVIAQLREHGSVDRGWLGVQIQQMTPEIASTLGLPREHGALVADATPNSPAARAGLKQADVIVKFNGHAIDKRHDLPRL